MLSAHTNAPVHGWEEREQEITVSMVWVTLPAGLFKKTSEWPRVSS